MSTAEMLGRLLLALAVVFGLMWVAARGLRRFSGPGRAIRADAIRVDVLARRGLGKRASVTVVQIGGQGLVLGVTDQTVRLLGSIDLPEQPATSPQLERSKSS